MLCFELCAIYGRQGRLPLLWIVPWAGKSAQSESQTPYLDVPKRPVAMEFIPS